MKSFVSFPLLLLVQGTHAAIRHCTTVQDIYTAMLEVAAGDEIVIAPGLYLSERSLSGAHFTSDTDGTEQAPIVMRSEDPNKQAVLSGDTVQSLSCVRIFGAFWRIQDLTITNAQKGIVFDNAPFGKVINCNVFRIGMEAIHWRDGSDFGLIEGCHIYNTGKLDAGKGEGIYIGSSRGSWDKYDFDVTYVTIRNCIFGLKIRAEALDVKEGTEHITIEYNTFDATGLSNRNFADSFIDLKGTRAVVRSNIFRRNNDTNLLKGINVIARGVVFSAYEHAIHDNYFDLDGSGTNMVVANSGTSDVYAWNNDRKQPGNKYSSTAIASCCPPWYSLPVPSVSPTDLLTASLAPTIISSVSSSDVPTVSPSLPPTITPSVSPSDAPTLSPRSAPFIGKKVGLSIGKKRNRALVGDKSASR